MNLCQNQYSNSKHQDLFGIRQGAHSSAASQTVFKHGDSSNANENNPDCFQNGHPYVQSFQEKQNIPE